jgi:hypothetical protein
MVWTCFSDMHSGGRRKLDWQLIFIEAAQPEAEIIFQNAFGRSPNRVTCTCCGPDYAASESCSLAQASGYHRSCRNLATPRLPDGRYDNGHASREFHEHFYLEDGEQPPAGYEVDVLRRPGKYVPLEEFVRGPEVKVIPDSEIRPEWRKGELRQEGYVWVDGQR